MTALSFAEIIQQILDRAGWDQKTLAAKVGVDPSMVSIWLNRGTIPNESNLSRLREFAEFDIQEWITKREYQNFQKRLRLRNIDPDKYISFN